MQLVLAPCKRPDRLEDPVLLQAFCGDCGMCKSNKTNLCGKVRAWTGKGIMAADDQPRFTHKESGKKIFHFVRPPKHAFHKSM